MVILGAVAVVVVLLGLVLVASFNGLVRRRNAVRAAWGQVEVQLKRRADLVPNLVSTVKGYAAHEQSVFEQVTAARAAAVNAQGPTEGPAQRAQAENVLSGALRSLFAVAEGYPDLKASVEFTQLQTELDDVENRISYARQAYNDSVQTLNDAVQSFPRNVVAGMFGFHSGDFFAADASEQGPVHVEF